MSEKCILELYHRWSGENPRRIGRVPDSGSNRVYYRVESEKGSVIGAWNEDRKENAAFLSFSKTFRKLGLPVPEILASDSEKNCYLITDLGDRTLFSVLQEGRCHSAVFPEEVIPYYKKVLEYLPQFQVRGSCSVDFSMCYPRAAFDHQSMRWDLNYFKYYFLKLARIPFDEQKLEDDFEALTEFLLAAGNGYFLYRDFQSRNVMLLNDEPWFIDYQGGRKGPLQYDVASLLYDAKADIPQEWREKLLEHYLLHLKKWAAIDGTRFLLHYHGFVLIRILQALGAYGYRGYYENKPHFLQSIPYALRNLKYLADQHLMPEGLPMLRKVLEEMIGHPSFTRFPVTKSNLTITVYSFSYKNGIPPDKSGHGGGFVFDCRGLPNPGKFEEFTALDGNDKEVRAFLNREPEVASFLKNSMALVSQSIRRYMDRDFTSLSVGFGCTGGQHRSVFCAEELGKMIRENYPVNVVIRHLEKENKKKQKE